jgi:hypothetical protein
VNIGITGTRNGATKEQLDAMGDLLETLCPYQVHHGDCVGVDEQFHEMANDLRMNCHEDKYFTVVHPPTDPKFRAFCVGEEILPEQPYLRRNRDIVRASDILIAVPSGPETLRSGTWSTVRYAIKHNKAVILINTDGEKVMM